MNLGIKNIWQSASNNQELETLKTKVDNLANTSAKTNTSNTFSEIQNFGNNVFILNDKNIQMGYQADDIKLTLEGVSGGGNARVFANKGELILDANTLINASNKRVKNVASPTENNDAVNKAYADDINNRITSIANVAAKTNVANTFSANQTINNNLRVFKNGAGITLDSGGDKFIEWKNGNVRESYIGRGSSSSRDFEINLSGGNLKITTADNNKITTNANYEAVNKNIKILNLTLGYGGTPTISPDEGTTKPLRFSNGNVRFGNLDFENQTKLANVANIKRASVDNISQNSSKSINLPANSIVLSVYNNSTGKNNPNFVIKDNGQLTITNNNDGVLSSYVVKYWEI